MPDGLPVPVLSLSLSLNVTSWTWGFDAQLPASAEGLVAPSSAAGPVELVARINGTDFRVLGERILRERVFGEASIRVSGRGHNAVLAAPYAPVMSFGNAEARTARQLMDDVLTETGIIEPGAFVEYQDGSVTRLGLVRSTQIEAAFPAVWQTLGVQSHGYRGIELTARRLLALPSWRVIVAGVGVPISASVG